MPTGGTISFQQLKEILIRLLESLPTVEEVRGAPETSFSAWGNEEIGLLESVMRDTILMLASIMKEDHHDSILATNNLEQADRLIEKYLGHRYLNFDVPWSRITDDLSFRDIYDTYTSFGEEFLLYLRHCEKLFPTAMMPSVIEHDNSTISQTRQNAKTDSTTAQELLLPESIDSKDIEPVMIDLHKCAFRPGEIKILKFIQRRKAFDRRTAIDHDTLLLNDVAGSRNSLDVQWSRISGRLKKNNLPLIFPTPGNNGGKYGAIEHFELV